MEYVTLRVTHYGPFSSSYSVIVCPRSGVDALIVSTVLVLHTVTDDNGIGDSPYNGNTL
jgi:hypothetical protein